MTSILPGAFAVLLALAVPSAGHAASFADFGADFSSTANPSGAWSYGALSASTGSFSLSTLVTSYGAGNEVKAWSPGAAPNTSWPTVGLNTGAAAVSFGGGNAVHLAPGQGLLHPGPTGDYGTARLTIAADTMALLATTFTGIDDVGTTTDVHVLLNGISLFSDAVNGFGATRTYTATLSLHAGDRLDFAVGWGSNGNYIDDSTGFTATLTAIGVAEPTSATLLALGLTGMAAIRRRRTA